ncbi:MAG: glutamate--cysteine ligase [Burkholderiales bacterium]
MGALADERLLGMRRGIEKESLRSRADGMVALTPHPPALGSALTHPRITTDFSESQLELITGIHPSAEACLAELTRIHQFVYRNIGDEMLWVGSMPCGLPADDEIPIARFGSSNVGRAKSIYRMGLSHRYGRRMQTISGIHYNWSMPGVTSEQYFGLIRNFRRHSFLLLFLFGASPAVCSSFVAGREHNLQTLMGQTLGLPNATSLRMGRLGYQSDAQSSLAVSYNSLESYAGSLHEALTRPHPAYEAIGIRGPDGKYRQLDDTLLQIENEFYGTIRPKRVIQPGERPLHALRERGVEYVEVRCMDLDPFEPVGISAATGRFIDMFLLHCLLADSPPDTPREIAALARNQDSTAMRGREQGLLLERGEQEVRLTDWGLELVEQLAPVAVALDRLDGGRNHRSALEAACATLQGECSAPSATVLEVMNSKFDGSYVQFIRSQSAAARQALLELPWPAELAAHFRGLAEQSIEDQRALEAADSMPFEQYREHYLSPARLIA